MSPPSSGPSLLPSLCTTLSLFLLLLPTPPTTVAFHNPNSYEFNLQQYQQQVAESQLRSVDNFVVTSENFGSGGGQEFDSVKHFEDGRSQTQTAPHLFASPVVNGLSNFNRLAKNLPPKATPHRNHQSSTSKCTHLLPATPSTTFLSPHYPHPYPPGLNCLYRIPKLTPSTCKLALEFLDFDLQQANTSATEKTADSSPKLETEFGPGPSTTPSKCTSVDYLEFNDQQRFCGTADWKSRRVTVTIEPEDGDEFVFRFVTISSSRGFHISYTPISGSCSSNTTDKLQNASSDLVPTIQAPSSGSPTPTTQSTPCEERHTELEFDLKSPGFSTGSNYTNSINCVHYVIRQSPAICGLELRFLSFALEASEGCAYDFLEIDGESFCGTLPAGSRNIFQFTEETKSISFQTDSKGTDVGFHIQVKQLTNCENAFIPMENKMLSGGRTQKCNFISTDRSSTLTSLKYPAPYPDDILCAYTIERPSSATPPNYCSVELHFTQFDLQPSDDCSEDFLEFQNTRFCGNSLNGTSRNIKFSEDGSVKMLFRSDGTGSTESKGFALNYTMVECLDGAVPGTSESTNVGVVVEGGDKKNETSGGQMVLKKETEEESEDKKNGSFYYREPCFKLFDQKRFLIMTDLVNGSYRENLDCLYTIRKHSPKVCYIEVHFRHFDLEASPDCQYDYVEIGAAVRLCGTLQKETSRIYRFEKRELYLNFHSDASTERSGFRLEIEQLECEGDRIVREGRGSGGKEEPTSLDQTESKTHPNQILQEQESISSEFDLYPIRKSSSPSSNPKFTQTNLYCSKVTDQKEFFLHSPGYPEKYPPDLDCLTMIRPLRPTVCKLEINFDHFELQPYDFSKSCLQSDFLDIDSKETLCGKMAEAQSKIFPFINSTFAIHFHSDSFKTNFDRGFRLFIRQLDCDHQGPPNRLLPSTSGNGKSPSPGFSRCNKIFTTSAFDIKSPLYPTTYLSNTFCQYRILKIRSDSIRICYLEVTFKDFDLQDSSNCSRDYLSLNGIKLCGSIVRDSVRLFPFYEEEFLVTFSSDRVVNGRGFHLQIRQNECGAADVGGGGSNEPAVQFPESSPQGFKTGSSSTGFFSNFQILQANQLCQQVHSSLFFDLESPNYPNYYLPSLSCGYTIRKRNPNICQLELYFLDFDIEPSLGCRTDYLLLDGVKYCNLNRPGSSSGSAMQLPFYELEKRILFRTTQFRSRKGFLAQVRQVDCSLPKIPPPGHISTPTSGSSSGIFPPEKFIFLPSLPSICEICVTEVTGNLQSYDYPNFYPPNVNCTYRVTPLPANCMVQMKFDEFDFDYSPECNRDYLEINGVRYCGSQLKGVSMLLLNKRKEDLSIRMVSHSRGAIIKPSFRGFRASYTQLPCLETPTQTDPASIHHQPSHPPAPSKTHQTSPPRATIAPPLPVPTKTPTVSPSEYHPETIFCDQTFTSERFEIKSPGYPYRYFDSINCAYRIAKANDRICRLKILFNYFNVVGEDGSCRGDYLELGGTGEKVCGVLERFTMKELPFAHAFLLLNFHTNHIRTANGFHLSIEQVDCYPGGSQHPPPPPDAYESASKTHQHQEPTTGTTKPRPPSAFVHQQKMRPAQEQLRYDDDETEFDQSRKTVSKATPTTTSGTTTLSTMGSSTMPTTTTTTTTTTRRPTQIDTQPHVEYEPEHIAQVAQKPEPHDIPSPTSATYPLRYFSHNITVLPGSSQSQSTNSNHPSSSSRPPPQDHFEQQQQQSNWDVKGSGGSHQDSGTPHRPTANPSGLCSQMMVEKMYFELSSADLLQESTTSGGTAATCQLHVKKAKSNICQLDIHFVRYWANNDTTCSSTYLSVDGERICGHVPANTIKKFWFIRPDLYLFVKLLKEDSGWNSGHGDDSAFMIKARQVECARNADHQPGSGSPSLSNSRPKSPKYNFYEQQQQLIDKWEPTKRPQFEPQRPWEAATDPETSSTFNRYCDLIASDASYKIVSPHTAGPHHCRYTIRRASPSVCALDIKFAMFRLAEELPTSLDRCSTEYLEIDGSRICGAFPVGHQRRYHFLSDQMEKFIYFTSTNQSNTPGDFVLEIRQIEDCSKSAKTMKPTHATPTICDISTRSLRGTLRSPNYPAPYDDYTRCTYRIAAAGPEYCNLKLVLRDLDIEAEPGSRAKDCEKDRLELSSSVKLCGREVAKTEYILPFESQNGQRLLQMRFNTDANGNGRGFNMDYIQELCPSAMSPGSSSSSSIKTPHRHTSPIHASKTQFIPMHSQAATDSNSLTRNPMRPSYPPNYVSKAHLLKSMDRGQFIKLMLMEEERTKQILSSSSGKPVPLDPQPPKDQMPTTTPIILKPVDPRPTTTTSAPITTSNPKTTEAPAISTLSPEDLATELVTFSDSIITSTMSSLITTESTTPESIEMA